MSTEVKETKVILDSQEVVARLSFLVGRTILFRDNSVDDATVATKILAVRVENTPGTDGSPRISLFTNLGVTTIVETSKFKNFILLETDGSLKSLGEYADNLGIVF